MSGSPESRNKSQYQLARIRYARHTNEPPAQSSDEYRSTLSVGLQKSQEDFDKTMATLSGGALGVSFAFLKDIIGQRPVNLVGLLVGAWACWAVSAAIVLISYFTSHKAFRQAITQLDDGQEPGGWVNTVTVVLNWASALLFPVGVFSMIAFIWLNLGV